MQNHDLAHDGANALIIVVVPERREHNTLFVSSVRYNAPHSAMPVCCLVIVYTELLLSMCVYIDVTWIVVDGIFSVINIYGTWIIAHMWIVLLFLMVLSLMFVFLYICTHCARRRRAVAPLTHRIALFFTDFVFGCRRKTIILAVAVATSNDVDFVVIRSLIVHF